MPDPALSVPLHNTFLIVRHGQSEANVEGIVVSTPENGCSKYGLTHLGRKQAHDAGEEIAAWLRTQGVCASAETTHCFRQYESVPSQSLAISGARSHSYARVTLARK